MDFGIITDTVTGESFFFKDTWTELSADTSECRDVFGKKQVIRHLVHVRNLWMESDGETARGEFSKKSVVYDKGKLLKHRARPPCRPVMPQRKPLGKSRN